MLSKACAMLVVLTCSARPVAADYSGTDLLKALQAGKPGQIEKTKDNEMVDVGVALQRTAALGYVWGIVSILAMKGELTFETEGGYALTIKGDCTPKGVSGDQAALVVERYLEGNPATLHHSAVPLVINAIVASFCPANASARKQGK